MLRTLMIAGKDSSDDFINSLPFGCGSMSSCHGSLLHLLLGNHAHSAAGHIRSNRKHHGRQFVAQVSVLPYERVCETDAVAQRATDGDCKERFLRRAHSRGRSQGWML